jgi:two-component system sensor histidine kinase ChvG
VIEHDVRRLDRLVSDISNASRLDSELVKEEEEELRPAQDAGQPDGVPGEEAREEGHRVHHRPAAGEPIVISGLEARLAQVFVNLITNAISFCEEGDAIRSGRASATTACWWWSRTPARASPKRR